MPDEARGTTLHVKALKLPAQKRTGTGCLLFEFGRTPSHIRTVSFSNLGRNRICRRYCLFDFNHLNNKRHFGIRFAFLLFVEARKEWIEESRLESRLYQTRVIGRARNLREFNHIE